VNESFRVLDGVAIVWFAYDVGQQIDLDLAQRRLAAGSEREVIRHRRRAPSYLQFHPAPVRFGENAAPLSVGSVATDGRVETTVYDFGALSIAYRVPTAGMGLDELRSLAVALSECAPLAADSRLRASALLERLGDAVQRPGLADLVEDYTVFHVRSWSPSREPRALVDERRGDVARVLRAEPDELSDGEVDDALQFHIAYGRSDDVVVDWNGAMLFEADGDDTLAVLEFANVELLEMRFLDDRLDDAVDQSQTFLGTRGGGWSGLRTSHTRAGMRRFATLQVEGATLFERVNNAIKLLGDQFLARVYRLAARRFHLEEWDRSILRKLQTLESIYEKFSGEQSARRMELLEWIVILLFLTSIALPFVFGGGH
jgi:hypothetical protein